MFLLKNSYDQEILFALSKLLFVYLKLMQSSPEATTWKPKRFRRFAKGVVKPRLKRTLRSLIVASVSQNKLANLFQNMTP